MKDTKIRWAGSSWNAMTGCTKISEECDRCYAETIALKFGAPAFPNGFDPTFKPGKLTLPRSWRKKPRRIFVNSMSDVHHEAFTDDQVDAVYDAMHATPEHDYLVLTKRPQRMARFLLGETVAALNYRHVKGFSEATKSVDPEAGTGWLARRGLDRMPPQIWIGTSIGLDKYHFRADWLRTIPALVRFLSLEPLLEPLPSLRLFGISWAIVGGESGSGFRPMDHDWARDIRDRCNAERVAFFFKQSAAFRTEQGIELDGQLHEEYPLPHPGIGKDRTLSLGVHHDPPVDEVGALIAA